MKRVKEKRGRAKKKERQGSNQFHDSQKIQSGGVWLKSRYIIPRPSLVSFYRSPCPTRPAFIWSRVPQNGCLWAARLFARVRLLVFVFAFLRFQVAQSLAQFLFLGVLNLIASLSFSFTNIRNPQWSR